MRERRQTARRAGAPSKLRSWNAIDWQSVEREVLRLQERIAKAEREERWGKVRSLQRILVRSRAGRLWAVRRVTTNKGKNTPGVDRVTWRRARQKLAAVESLMRHGYRPQPLRRIYISKKDRRGLRPLGIPTMKDRAMQALHLLALNPIAETRADPNSYGYRLRRSVADAWAQCYNALAKKHSARWVFEGDVESCFDRISHPWLLKNIPTDRDVLRKWLESGYLENESFHRTIAGTPQGGVISPVLANMALDGLEQVARESAPRYKRETCPKVNVIRFADDFIITAATREILVEKVIPAVIRFLAARGLRLSPKKSRITRIEDGFDFLGANIRKYGQTLIMKPAKANVLGFRRSLRRFLRERQGSPVWKVIQELNRRIRGWTNFYRGLVSSQTFRVLDDDLYWSVKRWIQRRHTQKRRGWLNARYFRRLGGRNWVFSDKVPHANRQRSLFPHLEGVYVGLMRASSVTIRRHVKVRAAANPFDPAYYDYFRQRRPVQNSVALGAIR